MNINKTMYFLLIGSNAFTRLERGQLTLTEFYKHFEGELATLAKENDLEVSKDFSTADLFKNMSGLDLNQQQQHYYPEMLNAVSTLRKNGILTAVLTNNWINDEADSKKLTAKYMLSLKPYFNCIIESSKVGLSKPDEKIYALVCSKLNVSPNETVFLDDLGKNLKAAKQLGMHCIKVQDTKTALDELSKLTSISFDDNTPGDVVLPPPVSHEDLSHNFIETAANVKIHYVDVGTGPVVILLHGFPDSWYGYRNQIMPIATAGYRVICPDQRGYGDSSKPENISDYSQQFLCEDIIQMMDTLCIPTATIVGHDWGGAVAWNLALHYPHRFTGVCGVNTPFFPPNPTQNPLKSMEANPGVFDYQLYFQTPGVAEKELEKDLHRSFTAFFQGNRNVDICLSHILSNRSI